MLKTSSRVLVIQSSDGFDVDGFNTRLDVVLGLLNHGGLGNGVHGNAEHRAALVRVVEVANQIIAKIDNPSHCTCNRHNCKECSGL